MALPRAPRESEYISPASEHEEPLVSRTESGHLAGGLDSLCLKKDRRPRGAEGLYVRFGAFQGNSSREIVAPKIAAGAASGGTPRPHSMATSRCRPPHIREGLSPDLSRSCCYFSYISSSDNRLVPRPSPCRNPSLFSEAGGSRGHLPHELSQAHERTPFSSRALHYAPVNSICAPKHH